MSIEDLRDILHSKYPAMDVAAMHHDDLVFEERVRLKCFQCRNYSTKWTCPGHLPQLDLRHLISEYEHLAVIVSRSEMKDNNTAAQTSQEFYRETANGLHRAMLYLESELFKSGNPLAQSFIGGSCELCKNGCPPDACAHPDQARIPWDAAGCNVTRTLANIGLTVDFNDKTHLTRYGLLLW